MLKKILFVSIIVSIMVVSVVVLRHCITDKQNKTLNFQPQTQNIIQKSKLLPEPIRSKYKEDIEQIINKEVPKSKELIDNVSVEIEKENDINIKQTIIDYGITNILFQFYSKLIDTTDKYVSIKPEVPATDWYIELQELITPYLTDNDVDMTQIKSLLEYAENTQNEISRMNINH